MTRRGAAGTAGPLGCATVLALGCAACGHDGAGPTWSEDVAAIVHANCTPCHRPGEAGPFALCSYDDAFRKRAQIARVTAARIMPPWLPTGGDFVGDRRLSADQVAVLQRWVAAGAPRGDAAREPPPPAFPTGWQLRDPDLVVELPAPLDVPPDGDDEIRNLVIPVELATARWVEAVELRPESAAVHHAILFVDGTRESRRLDALDARQGFPGMDPGFAHLPDGHFLGWTPGKRPRRSPAGLAWRLWPGQDLVLQLHLVTTGRPESVRPRIGLWFTDAPGTMALSSIVLFDDRIDIAPGVRDFAVDDQLVLPVPTRLHAIYPHAHYLGKRLGATATLPDGTERQLFAIDDWDFDWQDDYWFREPLELPAGTRVAMRYTFDNGAENPKNPASPPRRVVFGRESKDEMATLTLLLEVAHADDRLRLEEAGVRHDIDRNPAAASPRLRLAATLRQQGRAAEAFESAQAALRIDAADALAWSELGKCLQALRRTDDAEKAYRQALAADGGQSDAQLHLGILLGMTDRPAEAIELFERALLVHPNLPQLHNNLANALFGTGRLEDAERHYRRAVELDDGYFNAWFNLGRVLGELRRTDEARSALLRAQQLRPGDAAVARALAALPR